MAKKLKADLALLFITFIWGSTFIIVKEGIKEIPPYTFMFIRFCIGTAFLCLFFPQKLKLIGGRTILYGSLIGIAVFIGYAFQTIGLQYTTASKSAFITGLSVVLVPVLAIFSTGKKPTKQAVAGTVIAFIGLIMLTWNGASITEINKGDLYTLIAALGFSFSIILIDAFAVKADSTALAIIQTVVVAALNLIFMLWREPVISAADLMTPTVWTALLITGILATGLATYIQNRVQTFTSPTHTALIFACEPVFGALFAFIIAGEKLGWLASAGCMLILLGTLAAEIPWPTSYRSLSHSDRL